MLEILKKKKNKIEEGLCAKKVCYVVCTIDFLQQFLYFVLTAFTFTVDINLENTSLQKKPKPTHISVACSIAKTITPGINKTKDK